MRNRVWGLALLAVATATLVACQEDLDGLAACPALCPEQNIVSKDTLLETFIGIDSTVTGYPAIGTEDFLLVASRGDTLDARAVMRFDSLLQNFTRGGVDSAIYAIDSAQVLVLLDTTGTKATAPVTLELYDVDTTASDTSTAAVRALFRPDRLIGGKTYAVNELTDTLRVPLQNEKVLAKLTGEPPRRLRIGFRVQSPASAQIRIVSSEGGASNQLTYDPSPDTLVRPLANLIGSDTPEDNPVIRVDLADYQVVATSPGTPVSSLLGVGGLPAQRTFLRFDVPSRLIDSATIVRATLVLTQVPNASVDANDSLTIYPQVVRAAVELTDVGRAAGILNPPNFDIDSIRVVPSSGGQRTFEMVGAFRGWKEFGPTTIQRGIVLRSSAEGASAPSVLFYSSEAPPELRPRLRLTYVNQVGFGIP